MVLPARCGKQTHNHVASYRCWSAFLGGEFGVLRRFLSPSVRDKIRRQIDKSQKWIGTLGAAARMRDPNDATRYFVGPFRVRSEDAFVELEIKVQLSWDQTRHYRGSKLYYRVEPHHHFSEPECIFFWLHHNGCPERLRLVIPESARVSGWIMLRLDVLPLAEGAVELLHCQLAKAGGPHDMLDRAAVLHAMKLHTDQEVVQSIASGRPFLDHYPQALSMEIQPNCNLTCAHCPTHGKLELHMKCNSMKEMDVGLLAKIAHEVFPHVDCVNLVGRGEPLYVSDQLWRELINHLTRYGAMLVVVTNGTFIRRRITAEVLPLIETLSVSIDGANPETFARNRGGASFNRVIEAIAYFHDLRKRACLPRRPKLSISWTIKKNNVAELPGFVRFMSQFEPDKYFFRYMVLCEELEQDQSLLDDPQAANGYLQDAYAFLEEQGVEIVRPPLFNTVSRKEPEAETSCASNVAAPADASGRERMRRCPHMFAEGAILAGGAIMSCQAYFAEAVGNLTTEPDYMSVWSGQRMQSLRAGLNTGNEWGQCGECWISQMRCYAPETEQSEQQIYSQEQLTSLTMKAWDLRNCTRR